MSIPKGIQFKTVKPQGFYQEFRDYFITPVQTYTNQFSVYDIIRIQFNLQDWYIDPYESYIEAQVRLSDETVVSPDGVTLDFSQPSPIQLLMMDGPSTSLINDFRFEVNSKEIERIREYDQIGNLLTDLGMYPEAVDQKDFEGYYSIRGKQTLQSFQNLQNQIQPATSVSASASQYAINQNVSNLNIISPQMSTFHATTNKDPTYQYTSSNFPSTSQILNPAQFPGVIAEYQAGDGYTGVRSPYQNSLQFLSMKTDSELSFNANPYLVHNYQQFLGQLTAGNSNFGIQTSDYKTFENQQVSSGYIPVQHSPKLDQIDGHNIFLTNLPTSKIVNGKFVDTVYASSNINSTTNSRAYMQIPLLSGVMGVLIPQERWQLIPSSSLGQVNMEFRFNPNAFFSHDGSKPNWMVTQFQLRLRMYRFDQGLMNQLKQQVSGGIQMHSQVFSMGPIYNIQPNTSITNNWQLNNGIPSIKQLFFWFLSNDFENRWYARKNFKLCQNVTSMQLKIGSTYLPQNPIIGHAGNIVMNKLVQQDNSVYLSELHQAMNLLFDCKRHININKLNFAINDRPYDVDLNKMFGVNMSTNPKKKQFLMNLGYTLYNEMRCRGKAVYAFNLEMDKKNDDTMSGLDTTKVRPIELILKNDDGNYFSRQSTMYVMFLSDFIVTFGNGETSTEGAG